MIVAICQLTCELSTAVKGACLRYDTFNYIVNYIIF